MTTFSIFNIFKKRIINKFKKLFNVFAILKIIYLYIIYISKYYNKKVLYMFIKIN